MNPILKLGLIIYLCSFSSLATVEGAFVEVTLLKKGGFFNGQADTNQVRIYDDPTIHFNLEDGMLVSGDRYSEMCRDGDRPVVWQLCGTHPALCAGYPPIKRVAMKRSALVCSCQSVFRIKHANLLMNY